MMRGISRKKEQGKLSSLICFSSSATDKIISSQLILTSSRRIVSVVPECVPLLEKYLLDLSFKPPSLFRRLSTFSFSFSFPIPFPFASLISFAVFHSFSPKAPAFPHRCLAGSHKWRMACLGPGFVWGGPRGPKAQDPRMSTPTTPCAEQFMLLPPSSLLSFCRI